MTVVPYPPRHAARPRPHVRVDPPPRCTPSSLSGCRGDRVHVASCPHGGQQQPEPSALVFVGGACLTRRDWDRAWNCMVDVMLYGDPLTGAPDAAQLLAEELCKGPFGVVMASAA